MSPHMLQAYVDSLTTYALNRCNMSSAAPTHAVQTTVTDSVSYDTTP